MRIYNNIPAIAALNSFCKTSNEVSKSLRKLSTGLRVNCAADDAAGLAISEKMRSQIRGLDMAARNVQDGISMIQTAQGALQESGSILQRMRELAVQSANDTLTSNDRSYIQLEIEQLKQELDRIASTTQFNKKKLLDGSSDVLWSSSDIRMRAIINFGDISCRALRLSNLLLLDNKLSARAITKIDRAISIVSSLRSRLGAFENRLEHTITNLTVTSENLTNSESRIRDVDMAKEMMKFTKLMILINSGNSMLSQANQLPNEVLSLLT